MKKLKSFKVDVFDTGSYFTFLTMAVNHKKALRRLETHSSDYKNITHNDKTLTIKVTEIK